MAVDVRVIGWLPDTVWIYKGIDLYYAIDSNGVIVDSNRIGNNLQWSIRQKILNREIEQKHICRINAVRRR